ncbi:TPA: DUF551 domain-containing protein [Klebsiella variicola]|nr:MAG TPA: Protein of unknown function (DUF551) [Caudoviricetes sp.]HBX2036429.1 DUF551 domain-containing protein [Klebsiella variicola]
MTSKLTRERIELIANFHRAMTLPPSHAEIEELARMALAAMDSEPVAYISKSDFNAGYPHILARRDFNKACTMPVYAEQPAPVVPDDVLDALQKVARIRLDMNDFDGDRRGIAECLGDAEEALIEVVNRRAAMLQELKKSAGTEAICRSDENVQVLHTKSPAQSDCCPAQNQGWIPVSERMPENDGAYLCWDNRYVTTYAFIFGAWQANQFVAKNITHWMPLPNPPKE